jgi:hypothetical protein
MNRTVSLICRKAREMGLTKIGRNSLLRIENSRNELINYYNTDAGKQTKLQISLSLKELFKDKNNHPRGMLGKHQDEEFRKDRSLYAKEYWYNITPEQLQHRLNKYRQTRINNYTNNKNKLTKQNNPYSRCHGGKRSDIGDIYFRSSWEANFARICNYENIQWKYESQKFIFENVDDGILSYTPDFYLLEYDKIIEIKGWMNKQSVLRLEKFKKYYPNEYNKLIIITEKEYKLLKTRYKNMIENFE